MYELLYRHKTIGQFVNSMNQYHVAATDTRAPNHPTPILDSRKAVWLGEPEQELGMAGSFGYNVLLHLNASLVRVPLLGSVCNLEHKQNRRQNVAEIAPVISRMVVARGRSSNSETDSSLRGPSPDSRVATRPHRSTLRLLRRGLSDVFLP